jgi:solute carrier family 38 (sodium-coupled neutral amino acid transporter), member 11
LIDNQTKHSIAIEYTNSTTVQQYNSTTVQQYNSTISITAKVTMPQTQPPSSPFFAPSTPKVIASTPGGTRRSIKAPVEETKSSVVGTSANLINAIVGSGIVGIPYAIYCSGLVTGVILIVVCALLTMKSLRLLIFTAQHVKAPSYETLCEASFGRFGFIFISINMFIMAYGAMISYLMIVKDTLPLIVGVDPTDHSLKRAILFMISLTIMVPLSAQRDMAELAKTSRLSVLCDCIMVFLVAYNAPIPTSASVMAHTIQDSIVEPSTVFIGLGVLSFAFLCQHSAFIIAGSLEQPTRARWNAVTRNALAVCVVLALLCGATGYLGYGHNTQGNILNNLDPTNVSSNVARGLLGSTMLFVYPMESFVARHVLVVLLFQGRRAHEGEDATILYRRDRRWGMTLVLYLLALVPAMLFENVGPVLSVTGAIGGSCLSYIGPGMCYLGVYGKEFLELVEQWWSSDAAVGPATGRDEQLPLVANTTSAISTTPTTTTKSSFCSCMVYVVKTCIYYSLGMPLWTWIATIGAEGLKKHEAEEAAKSPHLSRIAASNQKEATRVVSSQSYQHLDLANLQPPKCPVQPLTNNNNNININKPVVVAATAAAVEEEELHVPKVVDFVIAIAYMLFGIVAMVAGVASIYSAGA